MISFFNFVFERKIQILSLFMQHVELTLFAVALSIVIGIPLGILIVRLKKLSPVVIGFANVIQSIPSIALLGFLIPFFGIGSKPAIVMVILYSLLPIIKNTYTGLTNVDDFIIESATGLGLTKTQTLFKICFPIAMPVIMSGIRISAVTAVGLMTIAAFIGAGGLGYLVYTGVQMVDNNMILAGAIPACILALFLDFVIGKIEYIVTPNGINASSKKDNETVKKNKKLKNAMLIIMLIIMIMVSILVAHGKNENKKKVIVIGSLNFDEQYILGDIMSSMIEHYTSYKVEKKFNLGGHTIALDALETGNINIYPEYTGTGYVDIMKRKSINDENKVYKIVKDYFYKKYGVEWLSPFGFNNTYVLSMKRDIADKYGINSISDLSKVSNNFIIGCTHEFLNRTDGYPGLQKIYGLNFKNEKGLDGGLRYTAIEKNETQVVDAFSTDGLLQKFNLKTLKDDKNFFPPYYAVPILKEDTLKKFPELKPVLDKLKNKISDSEMRAMNYKVDNGADPQKVADEFLRSKKLIK